jgi:threonine/homoserine/homoserine lactone efflux protein
MWLYIVQGIGYGLAAAAQPGPFQTYLISQTLIKGWKRTLPAALAPLLSDGPIIALCLLVLSQVPIWFQRFLYIAGGLFVLYLAYSTYKTWKNFDLTIPGIEAGTQQSVLKAALINTLNPNP